MQVFKNREKVGDLIQTGNTTVRLNPSVITIEALQHTTNNLFCDLSLSGLGGIDLVSIQNNKVYYIYAVVNLGSIYLIASTIITNPIGYESSKYVGAVQVDSLGKILMVSQSDNFDTDWINYIPSFSGFGSVLISNIRCRRIKNTLHILGSFQSGAPSGEEARIGLFSELIVDSNLPTISFIGNGFRASANGSYTKSHTILATPNDNYLNFGIIHYAVANNPITPQLGNNLIVNGEVEHIDATVSIQGWASKIDRVVEGK